MSEHSHCKRCGRATFVVIPVKGDAYREPCQACVLGDRVAKLEALLREVRALVSSHPCRLCTSPSPLIGDVLGRIDVALKAKLP